ncbi:2-dehydropantoate 2-reductase [Gudongella oleilytica]|jgi:2-dehydropantoate 2-reductase|uniref:ketopantoate reductase family protein n=1 Tax=Gudongella oleilytica TaxID=1582259 RepID=UPI002A36BFB9|nr:2-dehydropantoate 2-reductase [Gudongella oleilytica]MDY0256908.1 2-dehydropantoate 2-reductase [Gudongella oleilytica]
MEITRVSIVGMGSLGLIFGSFLYDKLGSDYVEFIIDKERAKIPDYGHRIINGKSYDFKVVSGEGVSKSQLIIFAVKSTSLESAIETVRKSVDESTTIISLMNGISSEKILGEAFGMDKILFATAEGMDPIRTERSLNYINMGYVCIGTDKEDENKRNRLNDLIRLFERTEFPYKVEKDVMHRLWSKFMLNVGVNQVIMMHEGTFETIQKEGPERDMMIKAMREVIALAEKESIRVSEKDLEFYVGLVDSLNPKGMPSMRHDGLHRIKSEVEMFAGTVIEYGRKHNVPTPINQKIYDTIKLIESKY